jgi:Putative Actinobacterial Holin-X, holin superfamily III
MPDTNRYSQKSTPELAGDLSRQLATLVHQEIALAKSELAEKAKRAGIGTGLFGGAGLFAWFGLGVLVACVVATLHSVMPVWLATLIVGLVLEACAVSLAFVGRRKVREASPPIPEQAIDSTKEDVAWLKEQVRSARR